MIDEVYTITEAAAVWGIGRQSIVYACTGSNNRPRGNYVKWFSESEARKAAGTWLITRAGMLRVYGIPKKWNARRLAQSNAPEGVLEMVLTATEAALIWGIPKDKIRHACSGDGRHLRLFTDSEARQSGRIWLVSKSGIDRVFGDLPK